MNVEIEMISENEYLMTYLENSEVVVKIVKVNKSQWIAEEDYWGVVRFSKRTRSIKVAFELAEKLIQDLVDLGA